MKERKSKGKDSVGNNALNIPHSDPMDLFPSCNFQRKGFSSKYLEGYIEVTKENVILPVDEGVRLVKKGTKFLDLHFDSPERNIHEGEFSKVVKVMREGAKNAQKLVSAMSEDRKLSNIDLIVGQTNNRLAKLAVRKLGFRYYCQNVDEAVIYATREMLENKAMYLASTRVALKQVNKRHKNGS